MTIHEPNKAKDTFDALKALYSRGLIRPIIYPDVSFAQKTLALLYFGLHSQIYDLEDLPKALAVLGSRKSYGKVIVRVDKTVALKLSNL